MKELLNQIACGDCLEVLGQAAEPFADLIFADPPFNIGYRYDQYNDTVEKDRYLAWTRDWMAACMRVLQPHGSFYVAIGDDYAAHVRIIGEELGLTLRNWIIWYYTFGQQTKTMFARAHTHIFYFVKDPKNFTFNDYAVRVPSDRQLVYDDRRADPRGKMPDDVWDAYPRVCGTFRERCGWHPCQMPQILLARIISVSSNPGQLVLDPFVGSGTTVVVAHRLARQYVGIDVSPDYVENARQRLQEPDAAPPSLFGDGPALDAREVLELQRLYVEIGINAVDVLKSRKLLAIYARQLGIRMNNGRQYKPDELTSTLKDMATWVPRKQQRALAST